MQVPKVKKLFTEQADYYSLEEQSSAYSPLLSIFLKWAKEQTKKKLSVCEFGGAAGQLLNAFEKQAPIKLSLINAEIVKEYQSRQVSKKIKFFDRSILSSKFPDRSFDVLVCRDVLHHLIGKNLVETSKNQKKAILELKRLAKPGGIILLEELVTESKISSRIIYYLSKLSSTLGLKISSLEISPYTIVSFLTQKELEAIISATSERKEKIEITLVPWNREFKSRLMHLGAKNWKFVVKWS